MQFERKPGIGLEATAHRLKVWCSTNWADQALLEIFSGQVSTEDLLEPKIRQRVKFHITLIDKII